MLLSSRLCIEIEDQVATYLLKFMHVISKQNMQEIDSLSKLELKICINKYEKYFTASRSTEKFSCFSYLTNN